MKILIIGASGFLGRNLFHVLKRKHEVYGTYYKNDNTDSPNMMKLDACNKGEVEKILFDTKPDIVIWAIMSRITEIKTMEVSLKPVVSYCNKTNGKVIYISTDLFRGKGSYFTENYIVNLFPETNPNAPYFNGKALGEKIVLENSNNLIIRTGMIYGKDFFGEHDRRINNMIDKINHIKEVVLYGNIYKTYTNIRFLVDVIGELLEIDYKGMLHVCNTKRKSIYEFYKEQLAEYGINSPLVIKADVKEWEIINKDLSIDTSMSNEKLLNLIEKGHIIIS